MGVINRDGALYFATGIDNSGLYKDAEQAKEYLNSIVSYAKKTGVALGAVFSVGALKQFAGEVINVRGEMQMLETSFQVLLGGNGVKGFLNELKQFAVESPLTLSGVTSAAQTLLGFNVAAEDVIPTIKQLGDISMGNEQRFQSLALAFAQMSANGKLMGQDLLQMISAGFNPLQEISAKTGKSISELKNEMEKGAISSEMVAEAFKSATSEGGRFYGMTQKQAEGIKGLQAQLEGSLQEMFNEIGQNAEKIISEGYKVTNTLVSNYENIGRVIAALITTYGTYRAAVVLVTAAEKGWTVASMAQYNWLLLVEKAQKLLNATMLKNPYVAVATAVVGLVSVLIALRDRTTEEEKAQKRVNSVLEEAANRKQALQNRGNELINTLSDETATVYQQIKAYKELIALLPKLKGKSMQELQAMKPEDLVKMLNEQADVNEKSDIQKQYQDQLNAVKAYQDKIKQLQNKDIREPGVSGELSYYREQLGVALKSAEKLKEKLDDIVKTEKEAFYATNPGAQKTDLEQQKVELEAKAREIESRIAKSGGGLGSFNDRLMLDGVNKQIQEVNKSLLTVEKTTQTTTTKNKAYWEDIKKKAEEARAKLGSDKVGSQEWNNLTKQIEEAGKELGKYSDKPDKTDKSAIKNTLEISQGIIDIELNLNKERIAILKDGREKRLKESEQEWKEQRAALDKEYTERVAKYKELGKQMPESEKKLFDERYQTNDAAKAKRDKTINDEYDKEYINRVKDVTTIFLNDEEKKREIIKRRYDEERKWAKEQLDSGSITKEQYEFYVSKVDESEVKEQRDRLLSGLNDFKSKEKSINEEWDTKIAEATAAGDTELLQRLTEGKEKALGELNAQMLMQSDEWMKLFENMDTMTAEQIQKLADTIRSKAKDLKLNPANLEAIMKRLREADNQVRTKNPFLSLAKSIKEYKKAESDVAKGDAFRLMAKDVSASLDQVGSIFGSITEGLAKMGLAGDEETQKMLSNIGEMIEGAAQLAEGIATKNPATIISGGVKLFTAAIDVFDNKTRKANRTIKQNQEQINKLQEAYEDLERAIDKTYSTKSAKLLEDEKQNLEQQRRLVRDQLTAEKSKKKPDKDAISEYEKLLKDIDVRINDTNEKIQDSLAGTDVMSAIDQFAEAYADAWTSGEKAAEKSANVVKSILKNALINYMKGQLQPEVDRLMSKIADSMKDGSINQAEQNAIDAIVASLDAQAEQYSSALKPYLDAADSSSGVTGELKQEMTEGTASQLVGLWNMTAMDIREIKDWVKQNGTPDVAKELNSLLNELNAINKNTKRGADNTDGIKYKFDEMNSKLEDIKKNTKQNNSRI